MQNIELGDFLSAVLPSHGIYCSSTRRDDGLWINTPVKSLADLQACIEYNANTLHQDTWFGLGTYLHEAEFDKKSHKSRFRKAQNNVDQLKALWVDIDIKPDRDDCYPSVASFAKAFKQFMSDTKLPWPYAVNSGHGVHLLWTLTEAVSVDQWKYLADRLCAVCLGYGLKIDVARTLDCAGAPRPPNTINCKGGQTVPTSMYWIGTATSEPALRAMLERLSEPYRQYLKWEKQPSAFDLLDNPPEYLAHVEDKLSRTQLIEVPEEFEEKESYDAQLIIKACQQVREAGTQAEPVWHRMIGLVKLCQNSHETIHQLSQCDWVRYNREQTDEKINTTVASATTCAEFNRLRPGVCDQCPHFKAIKSPLLLGMPAIDVVVDEVAVPLPQPSCVPDTVESQHDDKTTVHTLTSDAPTFELPLQAITKTVTFDATDWKNTRFEIDDDGCWCRNKGPDDQWMREKLTDAVIKPLAEVNEFITDNKISMWVLEVNKQKKTSVYVPLELFHSAQQLINVFGSKGLSLRSNTQIKHFSEMVRSYYTAVKDAGGLIFMDQYKTLGWGNDNEFVLGNNVVYPDGNIAPLTDMTIDGWGARCIQHGDLTKWVAAANHMFTAKDQLYPAIMFLHGFASPLMRFFPGTECTLTYVVGASGVGKSTIASLMSSIWFKPEAFAKGAGDYRSRAGATMNSLFRTASVLHSLPLYIDEATLWDSADVPSYVYDISSGQEKERLTSEIRQREVGSWRCTAMATANQSLRDKLSNRLADSSQHLYRVIEFRLNAPAESEKYTQDIATMLANYGWAGLQYARFLTRNAESGRLQEVIKDTRSRLVRELGFVQAERYWLAWATSILTGAMLAKAAGLLAIDTDWVLQGLRQIINEQRQGVEEVMARGNNLLGEFLDDNWAYTIVVADSDVTSIKGNPLKVAVRIPNQKLSVQVNSTTGLICISTRALRDWCEARGIGMSQFIDAIKTLSKSTGTVRYLGKKQTRLGYGVESVQGATSFVMCIRVRQDPTRLQEFIDEHSENDV